MCYALLQVIKQTKISVLIELTLYWKRQKFLKIGNVQ